MMFEFILGFLGCGSGLAALRVEDERFRAETLSILQCLSCMGHAIGLESSLKPSLVKHARAVLTGRIPGETCNRVRMQTKSGKRRTKVIGFLGFAMV